MSVDGTTADQESRKVLQDAIKAALVRNIGI